MFCEVMRTSSVLLENGDVTEEVAMTCGVCSGMCKQPGATFPITHY